MKILETNLNLGNMSYGNVPKSIVLHHAAASNCTVEDVNNWHKNNGWAGIGYHYFVRKNGDIYKGRPNNAIGAHVAGFNTNSLGICAEGNYTTEDMPQAQLNAIVDLCKYLVSTYGISKIYGHREVGASDCPGSKYPLNKIKGIVLSGKPAKAEPPQPVKQTWEYYISGDIIKRLQTELNKQFGAGLKVDGYCGTKTLNKLVIVRINARGEITRIVQELLRLKGYSVGKYGADGVFGGSTYNAVVNFQNANNLTVDGVVGRNTWKALLGM